MSLALIPTLLLISQVNAQFGQPTNANPFVDQVTVLSLNNIKLSVSCVLLCQMLEEVIKASNETIFLEDEQYVLVVDLFIFRPELQLEVTGLFMT